MTTPYIVIDCHAACYRAFYSTGSLRHGDRATGIPYGFFKSMLIIGEMFRSNKFLFCWDSKSSKRKGVYKDYKVNRSDKTSEELEERKKIHNQIDALRDEILPAIGFRNMYYQEGYEADDLIAVLPSQYPEKSFIAVSGDHDLYQLLRFKNFRLFVPGRGEMGQFNKGRVLDRRDFQREFHIPAREWISVKAIAGCKSDKVPGVRGIGESTAIKYLLGQVKEGSAKDKSIQASQGVIRRNLKLVTLPYKGTKPLKIKKDSFVFEEHIKPIFNDLGFDSFVHGVLRDRWIRLMEKSDERKGPF